MAIDPGVLVCPLTKQPLTIMSLEAAEGVMNSGRPLNKRRGAPGAPPAMGRTPRVWVRRDRRVAYPEVDGIPVLLGPEGLYSGDGQPPADLQVRQYAEAYQEMEHYNRVASADAANILASDSYTAIENAVNRSERDIDSFPDPWGVWLDATYDLRSQYTAYRRIAPVWGKSVLQLGGKGIHAVKLLLAGAATARLLTPMIGEIHCAMMLARAAGVADRLECVVGVAEEMPFGANTHDRIYSGGCLHHMVAESTFREISRVLTQGGKFAAIDPWRAPGYSVGIRIFGKREPNVFCRPLSRERVSTLGASFSDSGVVQHGALSRYPLIALGKIGLRTPERWMWRISGIDDRVSSILGLRKFGSSACVFGHK
jgi:uncharacterized protein YbaR (Trm112 family)